MTHAQLYEIFNTLCFGGMFWLLGNRSGVRAGMRDGAYEGAKHAFKLLKERGLIVESDDEEQP